MVYQHSIWQNTKPVKKVRNYSTDDLSYKEYLKKRKMREAVRKKQAAKTKTFIIFCLVFGLLMPLIFWTNLSNIVLEKFKNNNIKVPQDISFLNSAESLLADNTFMGIPQLDFVNTENPIMNSPGLTREMTNLTRNLKNIMASYPRLKPGIFIWDYQTGKYVTINADKMYPAASIIKLPVLFQLFRRAEKGYIDLNGNMSTSEPFITEGSGSLQYFQLGTTLTYKRLAELMIQQSDNTASNMLLALVGGMSELNTAIKNWGFGVTHYNDWLPDLKGTNTTSPMEVGKMLYNIDNPEFLSIESRAQIVEILGHTKNRYLIQQPLPSNVQFLHKTGDIGPMLGDAGTVILPDGRKYIIVLMVNRPWNDYAAKQFIIEASEETYKAIKRKRY